MVDKYIIVEISPDDAYFHYSEELVGATVIPDIEPKRPLTVPSFRRVGQYYCGSARILHNGKGDHHHCVFYRVKLKKVDEE